MNTEKIAIKAGSIVEGKDFYNRKKELEYAWKLLQDRTSLLLSAPRRVGKSSFSKKLLTIAEKNEWNFLYLDLQEIRTEEQFVELFKDELQKAKWWDTLKAKTGNTLVTLFSGIGKIEIAGTEISINVDAWRQDSFKKIKQLIGSSEDILIVIDELAIFLDNLLKQENGKEKVRLFLDWLRSCRQKGGKVRWVFCSSVGIENFASMHQMSYTLNDTHRFPLGAFPENEAKEFIAKLDLFSKVTLSEAKIQYILDKLSWYLPYFIQILVEKVDFLIKVDGKQLTNATIDEAYSQLIKGNDFNTWNERLKYYKEFEDIARKILKLCTLPVGRSRDDLLANLSAKKHNTEKIETDLSKTLYMLQNDGYLMENNGKYVFRSPLLRDFWYNRFIL